MVSLRFREFLTGYMAEEFDSLVAQLRSFFSVSFNEDGTLQGLDLGTQMPVGSISLYGGTSAPTGWLLCRGDAVSRITYKSLFEVIGTTYGAGDGSTTFNLPDLQQKFPLGKAASGTGATLGATGGAIDHTHTGPSHTHSITSGGSHAHNVDGHTHSISSDGSHDHGSPTPIENEAGVATDTDGDGLGPLAAPGRFGGAGGHTHNIPSGGSHSHTGSTGSTGGATDSQGSHDHGGSTGSEGTGNTGTNNPPFLSVNYIILAIQ